MGSIGRLQNSLVAATQETTAALANANVDFSIVKIEAPAEYQQIGPALSKSRQIAAESGKSHTTARRLGSLFEGEIPRTPHLLSVYGQRASEIANTPVVNPKGGAEHGAFQDFIGIDGTTVWAAATSSTCALAIHLLACILARSWQDPRESTAIWVELVSERKRRLRTLDDTGSVPMRDLAAANLSISKGKLAKWDASARAWLRAADMAPAVKVKQKQVMLILENFHLPVSNHMVVYDSVVEVWKTCLQTMEKVVQGTPHSIQSGLLLPALSAWHIYPDLVVLGSKCVEVKQDDRLVTQGGLVTLGLQTSDGSKSSGVTWSLSLAQLRYYGSAVTSKANLASRISMREMRFVVLGCLLGSGGIEPSTVQTALDIIAILDKNLPDSSFWKYDHLSFAEAEKVAGGAEWALIFSTARELLEKTGDEKKVCQRLLDLGLRRWRFISANQGSFLGLTFAHSVRILKPQAQLSLLRLIAASNTNENNKFLILLGDSLMFSGGTTLHSSHPCIQSGLNESTSRELEDSHDIFMSWDPACKLPSVKDDTFVQPLDLAGISKNLNPRHFTWREAPPLFSSTVKIRQSSDSYAASHKLHSKSWLSRESVDKEHIPKDFHFFAGDDTGTALFTVDEARYPLYNHKLDVSTLHEYLKHHAIDTEALQLHFQNLDPAYLEGITLSMRAFFAALLVYKDFLDAAISPRLLDREHPLGKARWAKELDLVKSMSDLHYGVTQATAFACITMFETGVLDLEVSSLNQVMAMSSGDSIYIAAELLCDPTMPQYPV